MFSLQFWYPERRFTRFFLGLVVTDENMGRSSPCQRLPSRSTFCVEKDNGCSELDMWLPMDANLHNLAKGACSDLLRWLCCLLPPPGQELPAPPALRHGEQHLAHGEPLPGRVRPRTRPAGPRHPRAGMVEGDSSTWICGRCSSTPPTAPSSARVPAAVPPPGPHGRRERPALRRRLPRHHRQERLGEAAPGGQVSLSRRGPRHGGGEGWARAAGWGSTATAASGWRATCWGRHRDAGRQDPSQGGRRRAFLFNAPSLSAPVERIAGDRWVRAVRQGHAHRQQLRHGGRGGRPVGGGGGVHDASFRGVGAGPVREPGGPHQRGVRGVLRPPDRGR
jgi:hypothetical protein